MAALTRRYWKLATVWALSIVIVGAISSSAQAPRSAPPRPSPGLITETPTVLSGNDIGFRVERTENGIPIGTVVVRIDGRWVDTGSPVRITPAR